MLFLDSLQSAVAYKTAACNSWKLLESAHGAAYTLASSSLLASNQHKWQNASVTQE